MVKQTHAEYDRIDGTQVQEELKMTVGPIRSETDYEAEVLGRKDELATA